MEQMDSLTLFLKMAGALAVILGGIFCLAWSVKLILPGMQIKKTGGRIKLIETLHLAPKKQLHLVTVQGKTMLLGSSEQGITLLSEIETGIRPSGSVCDPTESCDPDPGTSNFISIFNRKLARERTRSTDTQFTMGDQ